MSQPAPKSRTKKIVCFDKDCEKEVTLTWEEGQYTGACECGIEYGKIYTKRFYNRLDSEITSAEEKERKKTGRKSILDEIF
jgi:hypothetical protein